MAEIRKQRSEDRGQKTEIFDIYNRLTNQLINDIYIRLALPLTPYALYPPIPYTLYLKPSIFHFAVSSINTGYLCQQR